MIVSTVARAGATLHDEIATWNLARDTGAIGNDGIGRCHFDESLVGITTTRMVVVAEDTSRCTGVVAIADAVGSALMVSVGVGLGLLTLGIPLGLVLFLLSLDEGWKCGWRTDKVAQRLGAQSGAPFSQHRRNIGLEFGEQGTVNVSVVQDALTDRGVSRKLDSICNNGVSVREERMAEPCGVLFVLSPVEPFLELSCANRVVKLADGMEKERFIIDLDICGCDVSKEAEKGVDVC